MTLDVLENVNIVFRRNSQGEQLNFYKNVWTKPGKWDKTQRLFLNDAKM
jgi:hypothetical protein